MIVTNRKQSLIILLAVFAMLSTTLIGCGDSPGVTTLTACLSDFSELVENYKTTVSTDKNKQAEFDAKIDSITAKWTQIRNEYGSEITPQKMDQLVQQYDNIMLTLTNFKKTIGS